MMILAATLLALPPALRLSGARGLVVEQLTSFHLQFAGIAAILLIVWLAVRWYGVRSIVVPALIVLAGASNAYWVLPYAQIIAAKANPAAGPVRTIMSANVLFINPDASAFAAEVRRVAPEILVMTEVPQRWLDQLGTLRDDFAYRIERPAPNRFGMAVWSKHPIHGEEFLRLAGRPIPIVTFTLTIDGSDVRFAAVHPAAPVSRAAYDERQAGYRWLAGWAAAAPDTPTIVAGDMNGTPYAPDFGDFLEASGLIDGRRAHGFLPSWPTQAPAHLRIPIDHILANRHIAIHDLRLGADIGSDHLPVIASVTIPR